jgi:hypothetical protein
MPYALLATFFSSVILAEAHVVYALALAGQVVFYLLAGVGALLEFATRRGEDVQEAPLAVRTVDRQVARELA